MWIKRKPDWNLPESAVTSPEAFRQRRQILKTMAAGPLVAAGSTLWPGAARADYGPPDGDPTHDLYPVERNPAFTVERAKTEREVAATYTNYYEFGSSKTIWPRAQDMEIRPWTVRIDGMVEEERDIDIDDLIRRMALEERIYRLRCVEAWSMVIPWSGFPLKDLVDLARPLSGAKYLRMETFHDPDVARGQRASWYPWPYVEGLTMAEARNELAFMGTGMYGEPMPQQNGSPLRLVAPWKYGFKSIKGIVRITFTGERPATFWEALAPDEYGFWANVNPRVNHPRWSQASEKVLQSTSDIGIFSRPEEVATQPFNGYGEYVADLYAGLEEEYGDRLYR